MANSSVNAYGARPDAYKAYTQTYTSFSGSDIVATFGSAVIGGLSGITWSVTREKAPIYTMGSPNPRSFSRGKRGIAGSLIFTTFDRGSLYGLLASVKGDDMKIWTRAWNKIPNLGNTASAIVPIGSVSDDVAHVMPYYVDQIPPFDVTITFLNEYGNQAVKSIYGVELLNEGSGASQDDIVIEETMTYVAREVGPMIPTTNKFSQIDSNDQYPFDARLVGI